MHWASLIERSSTIFLSKQKHVKFRSCSCLNKIEVNEYKLQKLLGAEILIKPLHLSIKKSLLEVLVRKLVKVGIGKTLVETDWLDFYF